MALVSCKDCGDKISNSAKSCQRCGFPVEARKKKKRILIFAAITLAIWIHVIGKINYHSNSSTEQNLESQAFHASQHFVKGRLKAPSTAKFPYSSSSTVRKDENNNFHVNSYVDSENSFSAMIRTNYDCILRYDNQTDEWKLVSIDIEKQ